MDLNSIINNGIQTTLLNSLMKNALSVYRFEFTIEIIRKLNWRCTNDMLLTTNEFAVNLHFFFKLLYTMEHVHLLYIISFRIWFKND